MPKKPGHEDTGAVASAWITSRWPCCHEDFSGLLEVLQSFLTVGVCPHVPYHPPFHPLSLVSNSPWALVVPSPREIPLFNHYPYSLEEKCSQIQLTSVIEISKLWFMGHIFFAA